MYNLLFFAARLLFVSCIPLSLPPHTFAFYSFFYSSFNFKLNHPRVARIRDSQHTVNILREFNSFTKWMSKPVLCEQRVLVIAAFSSILYYLWRESTQCAFSVFIFRYARHTLTRCVFAFFVNISNHLFQCICFLFTAVRRLHLSFIIASFCSHGGISFTQWYWNLAFGSVGACSITTQKTRCNTKIAIKSVSCFSGQNDGNLFLARYKSVCRFDQEFSRA